MSSALGEDEKSGKWVITATVFVTWLVSFGSVTGVQFLVSVAAGQLGGLVAGSWLQEGVGLGLAEAAAVVALPPPNIRNSRGRTKDLALDHVG